MALALWCDYLLLTLCIPILPKLLGSAFSPTMIALVFASKPVFQCVSNPVLGSIVDRVGPKQPLRWGLAILSLSTSVFAYGVSLQANLSAAYAIVLAARSVQGVASSALMSGGMTLCALAHAEQSESVRGTAMGMAMIGVAFGTLLGPPLGGVLGYYINLWVAFVFVAVVLMGVFVAQLLYLDGIIDEAQARATSSAANAAAVARGAGESSLIDSSSSKSSSSSSSANGGNAGKDQDHNKEEETSMLTLMRDPQVRYVGLLAVSGNFVIGMIEPLVPIFLKNAFDEKLLWQGLIFGVASLSYLLLTPAAGAASDAFPKWLCLVGGLCVMGAGMCSFLLLAHSVPLICVSLALVGGGMAFVDTPILPLLADIIEVRPGVCYRV